MIDIHRNSIEAETIQALRLIKDTTIHRGSLLESVLQKDTGGKKTNEREKTVKTQKAENETLLSGTMKLWEENEKVKKQ